MKLLLRRMILDQPNRQSLMTFKNALITWVSLTIFYALFSKGGVLFWDAFYFAKDCVFPAYACYELYWYKINKTDKRLCVIAFLIYCVKFITELGALSKIIDISSTIHASIYTVILLIILTIVGYDRKN
jgi:hypothetical protein